MMPRMPAIKPPEAPDVPRTFGDRLSAIAPVVLTVVATVLAGLSSSEMTQAQYHRSLAAQQQSKAGDQWAFFQAKRTRGTVVEHSMDRSGAGPPSAERLAAAARQIPARLETAVATAESLARNATMRPDAEALARVVHDALPGAKAAGAALSAALNRADVRAALTFVGSPRLPEAPATPALNEPVAHALRAREKGDADAAAAPDAPSEGELDEALRAAEAHARAVDDADKAIDRALASIDESARDLGRAAQAYRRAYSAVEAALADLPAGASADAARAAVAPLAAADRALRLASEDLGDYRAARDDFTARRYAREAEENRAVAGLYELQVDQSSVRSDRHRRRSKNFFYGMLCAQAGVATASFALAARHKSGLWGVAGFAGLIAVAFSVYVYLYM